MPIGQYSLRSVFLIMLPREISICHGIDWELHRLITSLIIGYETGCRFYSPTKQRS